MARAKRSEVNCASAARRWQRHTAITGVFFPVLAIAC